MAKLTIDPGTGTVDESSVAPGVPGYRTAGGKSGYDPIDINREAAQMEGTLYRNLFTGRLRTKNKVFIAVMLIAAVGCVAPLVLSMGEAAYQGGFTSTLLCSGPLGVVGGFFMYNALVSIQWIRQSKDE